MMIIRSENHRLMAIDPGTKRIGIAISDLSGTISKPLTIINHLSRKIDIEKIIDIVQKYGVTKIIIGFSQNEDGSPNQSGENAIHLAEELSKICEYPVELFDEEDTTKLAKQTVIDLGLSKKRRKGHHDDLAAAILLQAYIESDELTKSDK